MQLREMTKQRMKIEVLRAGFVRVGLEAPPDGPAQVKWVKPGTRPRRALITDDPDTLPLGVREAVRARILTAMTGRCPLCDAEGQTMTREEIAQCDPWRLQMNPGFAQAVTTNGIGLSAETDPLVTLHRLDCAAAPRWLDRAAGAASN